ncbi:MAG: UPF0175 family protein [Candidatus Aenigmarchaeota archaeon]|nr:UPF0175 family protein [Candidatus Aenigmarchaeota archaeon]
MTTLTARIPDELVTELDKVSEEEQLDKSTVVRRLLSESLNRWREDKAVQFYHEKLLSAEQAAHYAKISVWRFFELLKEKEVFITYDEEELEQDLKAIEWSRKQQ